MTNRAVFRGVFRALQDVVPFACAPDFAEMRHIQQGEDVGAFQTNFYGGNRRRRQAQRFFAPAVFLRGPDEFADAAVSAHVFADGRGAACEQGGGGDDGKQCVFHVFPLYHW